jgi:UDP-GlcNAc:undecaprenyl-phosphate/decaprenyl-phosphate GlcNAc-1-phosphate transferase
MNLVWFFAPALAAALISYGLTPFVGRLAVRLGALDQPGPRKIHQRPIPRLGGLAVLAAIAVVATATFLLSPWTGWDLPGRVCLGVALGMLPIAAVSIRDDIKPLPPLPKFVAHLIGAAIVVSFGVSLRSDVHLFGQTITIGWLAFPLSVLWLVGTTNAFNIVDGLDGLSAGLALISAFALCGVFMLANQTAMAGAALVLAGGLGGFLPYNMFPARMFFGDTGATAIGLCLGAFALRGGATLSAGFATLLPIFVLGLPIAETLISMARRLLKRLDQKDAGGVFEPDANHMHHRLLRLGIDHPRAVFILYGAGLFLAGAALASMFMTAREAALLVVALLLAGTLGVRRLGYDEFAIIRTGAALRVYEAPVLNKSMFAVFVDVVIVATAVMVAVGLKTDDWNLAGSRTSVLAMIAVLAPITVTVFWRMGLYRGSWRQAGAEDFARACGAVFVAALLGMTARMVLAPQEPSLSVFSIYALISVVLVSGSRASYQILVASRWSAGKSGTPTLIYGAGRKGVTALRELAADLGATLRPVAFIDDDPDKEGRLVNGIPVVGSLRTIETAIRRFAARAVIVASDTVSELRFAELGEQCERLGVALLRLQVSFDNVTTDLPQSFTSTAASAMAARPAPVQHSDATVRFEGALVPGTRIPLVIGERCPACSSFKVHRSHVRKISERVRKKLTQKRLYRCEDCGWRGWSPIVDAAVYASLPSASSRMPALDPVDMLLHHAQAASRRAS